MAKSGPHVYLMYQVVDLLGGHMTPASSECKQKKKVDELSHSLRLDSLPKQAKFE